MKWLISLCLLFSTSAWSQSAEEKELAVQAPPVVEETTVAVQPASEKTIPLLAQSEKAIPVQLEESKKSAGPESTTLKMILSLSILGVIGCAGYFLIRKYAIPRSAKDQATQIKILTQHYLGPKKSLAIIRVAGESILVGITENNINMIKSLSLLDEDIPEETPARFEATMKNTNLETQEDEDFSITGVKDFVSERLKNMRHLG